MTLFDDWDPAASDEGAARRDDGIARAEEHADPEWFDYAVGEIGYEARRSPKLIADPIWLAMETIHPDVITHEPRAMGPAFKRARRYGWIESTHTTEPTQRASGQKHYITVWRSLLHPGSRLRWPS